ncbi:hypothetical protein BBK36DRAFT_1193249 [Trichoderma citrinoviride]|uniref:Zn(2)-C6 fungal-type domain-containing protein n=1 Tax=Trichoderma citrinoviride TaxID=58853 RepID=A0A2T4BIL0_9HYPO|nr:hypothetical protein BBK36DRAFT_1193249 [Trichoderma citrinoviride]PTB69118.1 hypothetical protein BBK36DRAFT_1193249 [Trichoderma citrinoviride]
MNQTSGLAHRSRIKRRACVTCTKAKSKCEPRTDNLCQRCARLGKPCVYLDLPERKRKRKDGDGAVRSGQTIVTTSSVSQDEMTTATDSSASNQEATLAESADGNPSEDPLDLASEGYHGRPPPTTSILEGIPDIVDRGFLTATEAESLVARFQSSFAPNFPFVVLAAPSSPSQSGSSSSGSAHHLRKHEPLLFLAVVSAVVSSAHPIRKLLADEIMQHVTSRVVAGSERNLGLLRALLVLCAWYRYPAQRGNVQLVLLLDLCVTMAYDLNLHRKKGGLTTEEQRALLGTYWVSTSLSSVVGRPTAMKRSKRIDECCDNMARSTEYPSDRCIRPMILTQSFIRSVHASFQDLEDDEEEDDALQQESLIRVMVGANLRQYAALKATLDEELARCPDHTANIFRCTTHYINIAIRLTALDDESLTSSSSSSSPSSSFATSPFRTSLLWHLLRHSKALIDAYVAIPDAQLAPVTVFTLAQLCASLVYLPRSVSALLKLIVSNHHHHHNPTTTIAAPSSSSSSAAAATNRIKIRGDALSEAQAVIDEADYLNVVARLYDKFGVLVEGLSPQEKGLDVAGTLCCHMGILAGCYGPRVKGILGVDLVGRNPLASMDPPPPPPPLPAADNGVAAVAAVANVGASAATTTTMQQHVAGQNVGGGGELMDEQRGYVPVSGAYYYVGDAQDEGYLFNDEMWSSVLESLTSFG